MFSILNNRFANKKFPHQKLLYTNCCSSSFFGLDKKWKELVEKSVLLENALPAKLVFVQNEIYSSDRFVMLRNMDMQN